MDVAHSLPLTADERILIGAIMLSILAGTVIQHYRQEYRIHHPIAAPAAERPAIHPGVISPPRVEAAKSEERESSEER